MMRRVIPAAAALRARADGMLKTALRVAQMGGPRGPGGIRAMDELKQRIWVALGRAEEMERSRK